jgi:hypothetical protein
MKTRAQKKSKDHSGIDRYKIGGKGILQNPSALNKNGRARTISN